MIPPKLAPGDTVRVVSPSLSLDIILPEQRRIAEQNLSRLGLQVTYSQHAGAHDRFDSSPVDLRLADLHAAFLDPGVKGILAAIGGFNCNQLLRRLDYDLIRRNPKVLCGYSDITALGAAIYAKTGLVTYSGPHFSSFGMRLGLEYTLEYFRQCLLQDAPFTVQPSPAWSDDRWYVDQEKRRFVSSPGYRVIHPGQAQGTLVGGNLCTLNLLQGTEYMPSLEGAILLLEDDYESKAGNFDRDLQSLLHLPGFDGVRGLLIGRFQNASQIDDQTLVEIIRSKPELAHLPVIANLNFGHCTPHFTFPVGGAGELLADGDQATFTIREH
jgi:muramoyltetrapeptide carboxypeptidase LdcA involved in peptidoglycan recycling